MNTENMLQTPSAESSLLPSHDQQRPSAGQLVRQARERARLTPDELAAQTKLPRHTVEALERDDYETLNEPVYIRGYYRKCAKVLGLADKELLDAYDLTAKPHAPALPSKLRLASGAELGSGSRLPVALAVITAIAAILVCAFLWFARGERALPASVQAKANAMAHNQSAPVTDAAAVPAVVEAAPGSGAATEVPVPAPADGTAAQAVGAQSPQAQALPAQKLSSSIATPDNAAAGAGGSFTLSMTAESWARVDDATGKMVINGLIHAGEVVTLSGTAPFKVFLGNAPGVRVEQAGKTLDIAQFTSDNKTARFAWPLPVGQP